MNLPLKGRCLCGGVTYQVQGPVQSCTVCHCSQCRRQSGHVWASAECPDDAIMIGGASLRWYRSCDSVKRGFCGTCGSFVFWKRDGDGLTSFSLGSLDKPTGLQLDRHIFVANKGDYYTIEDGLPQSHTE